MEGRIQQKNLNITTGLDSILFLIKYTLFTDFTFALPSVVSTPGVLE